MIEIHDIVGGVGVALILWAYASIQMGRMKPEDVRYSAMNAVGAGLILVSLSFDFNLSAAIIEGCWVIISLYGLFNSRVKKVQMTSDHP